MPHDKGCPRCSTGTVEDGYGLFGPYLRCGDCSWMIDLAEGEDPTEAWSRAWQSAGASRLNRGSRGTRVGGAPRSRLLADPTAGAAPYPGRVQRAW